MDNETAGKLRAAKTAAECYGLDQKVKNYNHAHWMTKSTSSLLEVNKLKFSQHPDLAEFLKKTGTTHIVEASSFRKKWGICISINSPDIFVREKWNDDNEMGKILMDIRSDLL